jgi:hypothetical protein
MAYGLFALGLIYFLFSRDFAGSRTCLLKWVPRILYGAGEVAYRLCSRCAGSGTASTIAAVASTMRGPMGGTIALTLYLCLLGAGFTMRHHWGSDTATQSIEKFSEHEAWFWQFSLFAIGITLIRALRGDTSLSGSGENWLLYWYRVLYDITFEPSTLAHIMLLALALAGQKFFFLLPVLLLDVVSLSETCMDVVRAVTRPFKSLMMALWLFLVVLYVFSSVGMFLFGEQFQSGDDDGASNPCPDMLHCYIQVRADVEPRTF